MTRRLIVSTVVVVSALVLLVFAWPQLVGLQFAPLVAQAVSLRAAAALCGLGLALVVLLVTLASRPFRRVGSALVVLLLVFVAANGAILASRGFDESGASATKPEGAVTVLAWNTLGDSPGAQAIADLVLETDADIVSLPETTQITATEVAVILRDAGRPMWVHSVAFDLVSKARSTSLLTSVDLGTYTVDSTRGNTSVVPSVVVTSDDGSGPTIVAAHPVAPIPGFLDDWRSDLEWVGDACTGSDIILAGDLNSTVDHYGSLANGDAAIGDCFDSAVEAGAGAIGTWPTGVPATLGAPIDHVMATAEWDVVSAHVIDDRDDFGSDHRPITATLLRETD
ncbi:endonuclease/exonuclease/phosphatase family protein [Marisediminicola sp. LYQ134]|uniref:endonuclease/exonuclease/phosphatase family protein n=1 Tax=unclassified Marisediminicola TaxID=2618316 RepID=UPI0039833F38